jgi:hypothetical protein
MSAQGGGGGGGGGGKSRWGSLLSQAVAGVEARLDTILAEEDQPPKPAPSPTPSQQSKTSTGMLWLYIWNTQEAVR